MAATTFLETPQGRRLAYHKSEGAGPTVVFLGGLRSDMEGTKAVHLEDWARARGQAYLRFDYSGHGESSGRFEEGCIGDWHEDTVAAVSALTEGPLIVVGSSMGGWQALLLARFGDGHSKVADGSQCGPMSLVHTIVRPAPCSPTASTGRRR